MTHTPTPWVYDRMGKNTVSTTNISGESGRFVCATGGHSDNRLPDHGLSENEANAAHIVKCVNAHDKLVEALRDVLTAYDSWGGYNDDGFDDDLISRARAALEGIE